MGKASEPQQMPSLTPNSVPVADALKQMIDERTATGIKKYGRPLTTFNGRDAIIDALQESLDLNQYLMQLVMELRFRLQTEFLRHDHVVCPECNMAVRPTETGKGYVANNPCVNCLTALELKREKRKKR